MANVTCYLQERLKLVVNQTKSRFVHAEDCEHLGFIFKGKRIIWSEPSLADFKQNVRNLTKRSWGLSMPRRLEKLSIYVRGWMNYYALSEFYRPIPELDEWLRRRVSRLGGMPCPTMAEAAHANQTPAQARCAA